MSKWIRKGDRVVVITGNEKGKVGIVNLRIKDRVILQGINLRKKHLKRTQQTQTAQIVDIEMPIHISNVRLCNQEGIPLKVRVDVDKGSRSLIYEENGKKIVLRTIKKRG